MQRRREGDKRDEGDEIMGTRRMQEKRKRVREESRSGEEGDETDAGIGRRGTRRMQGRKGGTRRMQGRERGTRRM